LLNAPKIRQILHNTEWQVKQEMLHLFKFQIIQSPTPPPLHHHYRGLEIAMKSFKQVGCFHAAQPVGIYPLHPKTNG